jgi:hypothetical protein
MATIAPTLMTGSGPRTAVSTTLTANNGFVYNPGTGQILILRNATAGALTPLLDGADGTTVPVAGIGNVSVSGGFSAGSVAASATIAIPLDTISAYLQGAINVTGVTNMIAILLNPS